MHPKDLSITDFTYPLPAEKIALHPVEKRDDSKLLIFSNGNIREDVYRHIANYLPENSLLVFNNTRVIPARILFKKPTGGTIEIFCLEPLEEVYAPAMAKKGECDWKCMIGGAGKWKEGNLIKQVQMDGEIVTLSVSLLEKRPDAYIARFIWQPAHYTFAGIIEHAGDIPLPPYIKREVNEDDKERYQTIYARHKGSVAAPTAGLHFTPGIFSSFKKKNIRNEFVTLHVGAGTFKPVKSSTMQDHEMHAEFMDVPLTAIENMVNQIPGDIIAIGTTSLRTVESLYWMGVKCYADENCNLHDLEIKQWEVYEAPLCSHHVDAKTALAALIAWMRKNEMQHLVTRTQILIAPGYPFKIAKGLVTNFHQPGSTLLLLVAAITKEWRKIYDYALRHNYRFLSYGDGCFLKIDG